MNIIIKEVGGSEYCALLAQALIDFHGVCFDHLQYVRMEKKGMVHFIMRMMSVAT